MNVPVERLDFVVDNSDNLDQKAQEEYDKFEKKYFDKNDGDDSVEQKAFLAANTV